MAAVTRATAVDLEFLATPFVSLNDFTQRLLVLETIFRQAHDRRAVFASAYLLVTDELQRRIAARQFCDNPWVERYAVAFANYYRRALLAYDDGDLSDEALTPAWRAAFEAATFARGSIMDDLFLGINAHINFDLPLALVDSTRDRALSARRADFLAINDALYAVVLPARNRLAQLYAPGLRKFDVLGRFQQVVVSRGFELIRSRAWSSALSLAAASTETERDEVRSSLARTAAIVARLITMPHAIPLLPELFRVIEQSGFNGLPADVLDYSSTLSGTPLLSQR